MPTIKDKNQATYFKDVSAQRSIVTGADGSADPLIAGTAGFVIVVRRIHVTITTAAAQSFTFRTNNGTPVLLLFLANSTAIGSYEANFSKEGAEGYVIPDGEDLDLFMSAAGPGAIVYVEAHKRPASNTAMTATAFAAAW
jgi:hypothetical protein